MEMTEIKPSELINADVTVIVSDQHGSVINGTGGVTNSQSSKLGTGVLGKMTLGA